MLHCHNRFWSWVIPSLLKKICYQLLNIDLTKFPPPFPGPPGPPGGLLVKNVAETSVELRWSRGYDNHSPIGRYIIRGRSSLSSQWKKIMTGVCAWVCVCVSLIYGPDSPPFSRPCKHWGKRRVCSCDGTDSLDGLWVPGHRQQHPGQWRTQHALTDNTHTASRWGHRVQCSIWGICWATWWSGSLFHSSLLPPPPQKTPTLTYL